MTAARAWRWIPTLCFSQGLPYVVGMMNFFIWTCLATLPSFAAAAWLRIDPEFGRKD